MFVNAHRRCLHICGGGGETDRMTGRANRASEKERDRGKIGSRFSIVGGHGCGQRSLSQFFPFNRILFFDFA